MLTITFRPTVFQAGTPFTFKAKSQDEATRGAVALLIYQTFLGEERHSHLPHKARLELLNEKSELHRDHQRFVNSFNAHNYLDYFNKASDLENHSDNEKYKIRLNWYPQVPCKPFVFPCKNDEEALYLKNLLANYDNYLLEECEGMRVDYCNTGVITIIDPGFKEGDDEEKWCDWFHDSELGYFDDIAEYLEVKAA